MEKILEYFENKKNHVLIFTLLFILFLLCYFRTPFIFFQQDELFGFGEFINMGQKVILRGLGSNSVTHFVPVTMSLSYYIFRFFGLSYFTYNIFGLFFHLINSFLVYQLARRMFNKKISAFFSTALFISSYVAAELIMWPVININTLSLSFALVSWLIVIDDKLVFRLKGFTRGIFISIMFLFSILSLEYAAGFMFFIPILILLKNNINNKKKIWMLIPFILTVISYLLFRFFPLLNNISGKEVATDKYSIFVRIFKLIPTYFSQLTFGQGIILDISNIIARLFYGITTPNIFTEQKIFPAVSIFFGFIILIVYVKLFITSKIINYQYSLNIIVLMLLISFSVLPFLLVPGEASSFTIFSSRYLYFGLAAISLLLVYILDIFLSKKEEKYSIAITLMLLLLIIYGLINNNIKSYNLYSLGKVRSGILNTIIKKYPRLFDKTIFYIESDKSYYGLEESERILPFQSGLGQALMVFYYKRSALPYSFFPGEYLWEIKSQGYKEVGKYGFGFYRNKNLLKEAVSKYNLPQESVVAFSWDSNFSLLTDISKDIRKDIYK